MNKQETKEMLEMAGVDITHGKAKALIEAATDGKDMVKCPDCLGKGGYKQKHGAEDEWDHCPTCDGKKVVTQRQYDDYAGIDEGWGASAQKRDKADMDKENTEHRQRIEKDHPEALKAYDAWRAKGFRGSAAAKKAVNGMPK